MRLADLRSFDVAPLVARARPILGAAQRGVENLRPYWDRLDAAARKYPLLAKALDAIEGTWTRLVAEFCGTIDPLLERAFPNVRLVAVLSPASEIELHKVDKTDVASVGRAAALDDAQRSALAQTKWSAIELRLRPDQVLERTLSLPSASRNFLEPIIEHRLERLTPWRLDNVVYGYRVIGDDASSNAVTISLVATSKDVVETATRQLAAIGLQPTAVGIGGDGLDKPLAVALRTNAGVPPPADSRRIVSRAALAVFGVLGVIYLVTAMIASNAVDAQETAGTRLIKARRLLKAATLANVSGPEKTLLIAKQPDKSLLVLVDKLAQAIPQDTYLKELAASADKVRLAGTSGDAPALVGRLEAIGLANVRFSAAVTRGPDGKDSFEITADRAVRASESEGGR